jgi:hypothetical protein
VFLPKNNFDPKLVAEAIQNKFMKNSEQINNNSDNISNLTP